MIKLNLPRELLPNRRFLVEEVCGGGFSICEAVGARDWRMEYVRCILRRYRAYLREDAELWVGLEAAESCA